MHNTIKKLSLTFILLNVFTFQSLMADMMFYYSAAILPSIISSQKQELTANYDELQPIILDYVEVDVLANDTIPNTSSVTVLLEQYLDVYTDSASVYEGTWYVDNNNYVYFVPNPDFSGGIVEMWYQITDQHGNTSKSWIRIVYPVLVQAVHDEVSPASIEPINLDVLANDGIAEGSTVTVLFEIFGLEGQEFLSTVETIDGNWSVESNQSVTFIPNENFGGGDAWMQYQITDQDGHTSKNDILIRYPQLTYAEYDYVQKVVIEQVTVDVLANDTIEGALATLLLESHNPQTGELEYVSNVDGYGGMWIVDGPTVMFIPEANFGGGSVGIWYQITDDQGHVSQTWISIDFPLYVQADYDHVQANVVETVTVNVLENDTIGEGVVPTVLFEIYGQNGPEYVPTVDMPDGTWMVEVNQSVTFTPNVNFSGRYAQMQYQLSDGNGHMSTSGINIEYPVSIYAEQDYVEKTVIETVTIDVVANDTNSSPVTVQLEIYTPNGQDYVSSVEAFDGNWTVEADQSVTFTPNINFGGGQVWMWYQITDEEGRTSTNEIGIDYPVVVYAEWDQVMMPTVELATVNVLDNDTNTSAVTILLVNQNWNTGSEEFGTIITTDQGIWTVSDTEVFFEPNGEFSGGSVYMEYQISDQNGRISRTSIEIIYPVTATAECIVSPINTVEGVYTTLTSNLSFDYNNGRRNFEPELDINNYTIDPALYVSSTDVTGVNPMYMVWYNEQTWQTPTGDTFESVEMSPTEVLLNGDGSWSYADQKSGNDRGYKYVGSQGESGTYVVENDGSNTLSINSEEVFSLKIVRNITENEINNIFENIGIMLTLEAGDTAQLHLSKELMDNYNWWGPVDGNTYTSLNDFIVAKEHNVSQTQFYDNAVLSTPTWQKVIIFAEGSSGQTSGTLVEIDRQTNEILTDTAGTWNIETITDDQGATYNIIVAESTLCGYEKRIFKLDGSTIMQGQRDEAGVIGAELGLSSTLKDKLLNYFITEAPLDIDPNNPTSPEITEVMLSGKTFYTVNDREDGTKDFAMITIESSSSITLREILVDAQGTILADSTGTIGYRLNDGRIEVEDGQDSKIWLNSDPSGGDWSVTFANWSYMDQQIWLLNEPGDFPQ